MLLICSERQHYVDLNNSYWPTTFHIQPIKTPFVGQVNVALYFIVVQTKCHNFQALLANKKTSLVVEGLALWQYNVTHGRYLSSLYQAQLVLANPLI